MNADTTGGGRALRGGVLGGTAGDGWGRAAAYDAYADGLHTYALWYLRDHDAAADALYCAFAAADRNHTTLQQPEQIQPWLYALLRRECRLRAGEGDAPTPVSGRLRPKADGLGDSGVGASLLQLEGNLRRAEFHSLAWSEAEGLAPAHREVLELTIRHGLDSRGLALVLGLREGAAGLASTRGFGLLADAWRELERSLAAAAVAGSGRDNCAQLAELTFGWSGKLNATLRAPLTEHVDRCSRCQHYLHTVIGTPSAPTILPFVAAPRALRDLLLGELADADAAQTAGVDLIALGRRCGSFGSEGFPARVDLSQNSTTAAAGTGGGSARPPRRRQASARLHRTPRAGGAGVPTGAARPAAAPEAARSEQQAKPEAARSAATASSGPAAANSPSPTSAVRPTARTERPVLRVPPRVPEAEDLFRARGSWAERVLPPQIAAAAAAAEDSLWRPEPAAEFIQTPSGRFATRTPLPPRPPRPQTASSAPASSASRPAQPVPGDAASAAEVSRLPRYARGNSRPAGARARHKARPMRQAVVSAMALGAIGAVAATAAALLGSGGDPQAKTIALENTQPNEVVGGAQTPAGRQPTQDRLSVTVTTAGGGAAAQATGLGSPLGTGSSAAVSSPTVAASGGFFVSVNQRDGDPYSVQILLRNAGTTPLKWSASPDVSWLTLSQRSGTLAPGASLAVTATATSAAPSGQWVAHITFQPGGILVTVHGGVAAPPSSAASSAAASASAPASASASSTPTVAPSSSSPSSAPTSPSSTASTTPSTPSAPPASSTTAAAGDSATPSQTGGGATASASASSTRIRRPAPSRTASRHAATR
ncbi:BACON domain-containing protein [Actinospica robiniae]|uniref:BACON domain-containing protein n=1 Tax=Actinospica robiniae TaxID=304901 RepID=UPI0012F9CA1F|nr:hypothetical protein [Actinospica robiniae]